MKLNRNLRLVIRASILTIRDILIMIGLFLALVLVLILINSIFGPFGILMNFMAVGILITGSVLFTVHFNELNQR